MKMKSLVTAAIATLATIATASAEVKTYQGSSRWISTLFTPNVRTTAATTSYTSYYLVETSGANIVGTVKIDAWTAKSGNASQRRYYVDQAFKMEYGFFGIGGVDAAGGMNLTGISAVLPFRGTIRFGDLSAFSLYPAADYYPNGNNLDITTITGSARLNAAFSGNVSLNTAANAVMDYLESRGFYEVK